MEEGRPGPLSEVAGPLDRQQRHFVGQIIENFVPVQILDVPMASVVPVGEQNQILQPLTERPYTDDTEQEIADL